MVPCRHVQERCLSISSGQISSPFCIEMLISAFRPPTTPTILGLWRRTGTNLDPWSVAPRNCHKTNNQSGTKRIIKRTMLPAKTDRDTEKEKTVTPSFKKTMTSVEQWKRKKWICGVETVSGDGD